MDHRFQPLPLEVVVALRAGVLGARPAAAGRAQLRGVRPPQRVRRPRHPQERPQTRIRYH